MLFLCFYVFLIFPKKNLDYYSKKKEKKKADLTDDFTELTYFYVKWIFVIGSMCLKTSSLPQIFHFVQNYYWNDPNDFKGAGGPRTSGWSKSNIMLFVIERNPTYQMLFTRSQNIVPNKSYRILKFRKYRSVRAQTLIAISQKWPFLEFQNLSPSSFLSNHLEFFFNLNFFCFSLLIYLSL